MKKEIVFIDEETLTKEELQATHIQEQTACHMKRYYDEWRKVNGETKE
jgi:hypothetical protein